MLISINWVRDFVDLDGFVPPLRESPSAPPSLGRGAGGGFAIQ